LKTAQHNDYEKWEIDNTGEFLLLKASNKSVDSCLILELTKSKFVFLSQDGEGHMKLERVK
ncbi:MAG: hypothetical protein AAF734_12040, partial [Bacteroidota bacterium]